MDIKKAIGIKCCDIDVKTGETLTHSEIYGRAIELLGGLNVVARFVPFPVNVLRERLKEDPDLNNTPLSMWDRAAGFSGINYQGYAPQSIDGGIRRSYLQQGITISNAEGVCILKEAARRLVEKTITTDNVSCHSY